MRSTDKDQFADAVRDVVETLGGRSPTDRAIEVWFDALKEFPVNDVLSALYDYAKFKSKAPAPADIRKIVTDRISERLEEQSAEAAKESRKPDAGFEPAVGRAVSQWKEDLAKATAGKPDRLWLYDCLRLWKTSSLHYYQREMVKSALGREPTDEDIARAKEISGRWDRVYRQIPEFSVYVVIERNRDAQMAEQPAQFWNEPDEPERMWEEA